MTTLVSEQARIIPADRDAATEFAWLFVGEDGKVTGEWLTQLMLMFARHRFLGREQAAKIVDTHKPDASFDDSQAGAAERNALLNNIAAEIRNEEQS